MIWILKGDRSCLIVLPMADETAVRVLIVQLPSEYMVGTKLDNVYACVCKYYLYISTLLIVLPCIKPEGVKPTSAVLKSLFPCDATLCLSLKS